MKKKKKEPNSVMSNLNILIDKSPCAYTQSRVKNIFKILEVQLEADEFIKLKELYSKMNADNSDTMLSIRKKEDCTTFTNYTKSLMRKYAKNR